MSASRSSRAGRSPSSANPGPARAAWPAQSWTFSAPQPRSPARSCSRARTSPASRRRSADSMLGRRIGAVFQDPFTSLNPALRVGRQIAEPMVQHLGLPLARGAGARRDRVARDGDRSCGRGRPRLPAPAIGRDEAARADRRGARLRTAAPDPRRADDGARRHRRGADPALAVAPQTRQGHCPPVHQPQSQRRSAALRRRRSDVCEPARRARRCPSRAGAARPSLQQGIAGVTASACGRVAGQPTRGY